MTRVPGPQDITVASHVACGKQIGLWRGIRSPRVEVHIYANKEVKLLLLDLLFRAILSVLEAARGLQREPRFNGAIQMEWVKPQHEEIELNCEVSSYANAEL
jgi:hypothetical protein